jgi:purine-binding chemotaxis protein CheW
MEIRVAGRRHATLAPQADVLFVRTASLICAIPLAHVAETMRPLPMEPAAGAPPFVLGLSVIRGQPVPVVDLGSLLGDHAARPARWVTLRVGARRVALAVDAVVGAHHLGSATLEELPPLLRDAHSGRVESLGALDSQLLLVLRTTRLLPEDLWDSPVPKETSP